MREILIVIKTALMIFGMIVLLIGAFVNFAYADENKWTKEDTAYQALFSSLLMTDWLQTKEAVSNGVRENNPILGEHPSQNSIDAFGASVMLGHLAISKLLPKDYRRKWQLITIGIESQCVYNNYRVGVRINF